MIPDPNNQDNQVHNEGDHAELDKSQPKILGKFNDVAALEKSYVELEGKLGRSIEIPKDSTDSEQWNRVYDRLGRPKTADEYELAVLEDEGLRKTLAEAGIKEGANKAQLKGIASALKAYNDSRETARKEAAIAKYNDAESKLKAKHGEKYTDVTAKAVKAFDKMFQGKEDLLKRLRDAGFDNDPDMVESFADFYSVIAPDENPLNDDKGGASKKTGNSLDWMYAKYGGSPTPGRT